MQRHKGYRVATGVFLIAVLGAFGLAQSPRRIEPIRVQKKLALVIGNSGYSQAALKNPLNDASAMAAVLRRLDFTVKEEHNLKLRDLQRAVDQFAAQLHTGDFGLFYYSGHGVQVNQENYLLPVDFKSASEADIPYVAYPAARVRDKMEDSGARLRVMILDACRDNPYRSKRGIGGGGLATMKADKAEGTLIAFATGDNNTAEDNPNERNGLFTKYLVEALQAPGVSLDQVFKMTREKVFLASGRKQNPFTYDNVIGVYYFKPATEETHDVIPTVAGTDGLVRLEAVPWAELKEVRKLPSGDEVVVTGQTTPLELALPAGAYKIVLTHPKLGDLPVTLNVEAGKTITVRYKFDKFDIDQILNSYETPTSLPTRKK